MTDYSKLVEALRSASTVSTAWEKLMIDAADAIEALQAEVERLKDCNEELREKQTFIDHYGTEWMTSAKDVPTAAYKHGYADGRDEAEAQLPKQGKWVREMNVYDEPFYHCSACGECFDSNRDDTYGIFNYCPNCGAKMTEVQDA